MLFVAKCYWPGVTETELEALAARAPRGYPDRGEVDYLGSLMFSADDLVLCLFEGPSRSAVHRAAERAGIPSERLMDCIWLAPGLSRSDGPAGGQHQPPAR